MAELQRKRDSLSAPTAALEAELADEASRRVGVTAERAVRSAARHLELRLGSAAGTDGPSYLKHAFRVALMTLRWDEAPSADTLALAVLHNVHEISGPDEVALAAAGFSARVISGVRVLTIDRPRDEDETYLCAFYAAVEAAGAHVALVRCADKIDNLLGYDISGGGPRRVRYVDLTERFVLPIARRLSEPLGRFLAAVIAHARSGG